MNDGCPSCGSPSPRPFYRAAGVPTNSVLLLPTRREAECFPTGDVSLALCAHCGFVFNRDFDPSSVEYSARYEETQGYSPTFRQWQSRLIDRLVRDYELEGRSIIEIGCGKGEFLAELCERGNNQGIGFDPAYVECRSRRRASSRVMFVRDFFSEQYSDFRADFVVCKMTLEHIAPVASFVRMVRRALDDQPSTVVFFQVPNAEHILRQQAFWDVYYEHCSYFTPSSLRYLFETSGFDILEVTNEYGEQYLTLTARPSADAEIDKPGPAVADNLLSICDTFGRDFLSTKEKWRRNLAEFRDNNQRIVVWGSGSKGVSFLTSVDDDRVVEFVVDINPHRQHHFMASTGQEIIGPSDLTEYRPDAVIAMNPIYRDEITADLEQHGLQPEVMVA